MDSCCPRGVRRTCPRGVVDARGAVTFALLRGLRLLPAPRGVVDARATVAFALLRGLLPKAAAGRGLLLRLRACPRWSGFCFGEALIGLTGDVSARVVRGEVVRFARGAARSIVARYSPSKSLRLPSFPFPSSWVSESPLLRAGIPNSCGPDVKRV